MKITIKNIELVAIPAEKPFYLGIYPIICQQYARAGGTLPLTNISWYEIMSFCDRLTKQKDHDGIFTLPTEAQWEFACRAGSTGDFGLLKSGKEGTLDEMGWYADNSGNQLHAVGLKRPNAWGLYDMHGNVWEWCEDRYNSSLRVIRGGSWYLPAASCRAASRDGFTPEFRISFLGFRVAFIPNPDGPLVSLANRLWDTNRELYIAALTAE